MHYYLKLPTFEVTSKAELEDELSNLRLAFQWALKQSERELLSEFWNGMKDFLMERGLWNIFVNWGKATLLTLPKDEIITRAWLLADLGWLAMEQSNYNEARELFEQAHSSFNSIEYYAPNPHDHKMGLCAIERYLGVVHYRMGDYETASHYYSSALRLAKQFDFPGMVAETYNLLGSLARKLGDYSEARDYYHDAISIMRKTGKEWHIAAIMRNLARLDVQMGEFEKASARLQEAIALCNKLGRKDMLYGCQLSLAETQFELGNLDVAIQLAKLAREGFADLGMIADIERAQNLIDKIEPQFTV